MDTFLIKREMVLNGINDISLVPAFKRDSDILKKIEANRPILTHIIDKRKSKTNRSNWALIHFFIHNMPEYIEKHIGKKRSQSEYFVREWLKLEVGFCDPVMVGGDKVMIPRKSDARSLPDESEYIKYLKEPMESYISNAMGFPSVYEMLQASISH